MATLCRFTAVNVISSRTLLDEREIAVNLSLLKLILFGQFYFRFTGQKRRTLSANV